MACTCGAGACEASCLRTSKSVELDSICMIDLEQVKLKIMKRLGWDRGRVEQAAWSYVQFLHQFVGDKSVKARPPSDDLDEVWHQHILYTRKYAEDCKRFLGFFLHHTPDKIERVE